MDRRDPIVVLGPTATGKSALGMLIARRLGGLIIGADSVQVYRGLDAGSCKPPLAAREEVPHALIDVADPGEPFSAGRYARMAGESIDAALAGGRVPIVVGGTGLYLKALLHGIAPMPPRNDEVRRLLYERARSGSPAALHAELAACDPESASRIGQNDLQRIVRALAVVTVTGRPMSRYISESGFEAGRMRALKIGLTMDRERLYRRIEDRVDRIFASGLVEETRNLLASGVPPDANALKALGYREVLAHLRGEIDLPRAVDLVKRNTRRYARRQLIWFRREAGVHWFDVGAGPARLEAVAGEVVDLYVAMEAGNRGESGERTDG